MPSKKFTLKLVVVAVSLIYAGISKAEQIVASTNAVSFSPLPVIGMQNTTDNTLSSFPFLPRVNLYAGSGSNSYGRLDAMVPLFGSSEGIIYTDLEGQRNSSNNNYLSIGLGGRNTVDNNWLWGGYIFADRLSSAISNISNKWTLFNPGIEWMNNEWDSRLNAYIPSDSQKTVRTGLYGDQVGESDAISFEGHNQYSVLFDDIQEIGPGADIDIGYTLSQWHRFRIHGGGYYFHPKDTQPIHGGEIGAEYPINDYLTVEAIDTYDNVQNNKALLSLRVTLGGIEKVHSAPNIQDRILDPVYHNFAGMAQGTIVPISEDIVRTDQTVLERSNIWFFSPSGIAFDTNAGINNCTYEHPCAGSQFNQQTLNNINGIASNANIYLSQGTYNSFSNNLTVNAGQSLFGRTVDYTLPATPSDVQLIGSLILQSNTSLNNLWLLNNGTQTTGITLTNATNVTLNNVTLGALNASQGYANGITMGSASSLTLNNSTINAFSADIGSAYGIQTAATSALTINNSAIYVDGESSGLITYGLYNLGNATINNSTISVAGGQGNANNITSVGDPYHLAYGISNTGTLAINNSIISVSTSFSPSYSSTVYGIYNDGGTATINNTQIRATVDSAGNLQTAYGIFNSGILTLDNSMVSVNGPASSITAISGSFSGSGNTCKKNGVVVSC